MTKPAKTWKEKQIEKEKDGESGNESEGNEAGQMGAEINMVFHLPAEFELLEQEVARLDLGAKRAVFEKPEEGGGHMKPLCIREHLDGTPVDQMLVDAMCIVPKAWSRGRRIDEDQHDAQWVLGLQGANGW
jgi:hypothetical protein